MDVKLQVTTTIKQRVIDTLKGLLTATASKVFEILSLTKRTNDYLTKKR